MFDFFRKRIASPKEPADVDREAATPILQASQQTKQAAMAQVDEVVHDEAEAVEFILQCQFADARLKAAQFVHSRPMVERVLHAVRNSDRRVAKLMHARLQTCKQWEHDEQFAHRAIEQAQRLIQEVHLTASQVADLDKHWQQLKNVAPPLQQRFQEMQEKLLQRLEAQTALQRRMLDAIAQLQILKTGIDPAMVDAAEKNVRALEHEVANYAASQEVASLPRHLLTEFSDLVKDVRLRLRQAAEYRQAISSRQEALNRWEASNPISLGVDEIKTAWHALPPLPQSMLLPLEDRLDRICRRIPARVPPEKSIAAKDAPGKRVDFSKALARMEAALEAGELQSATEADRDLRTLAGSTISTQQTQRLHKARAELHRLQGWARWGGKVSREELLQAVQALPTVALPPVELAKTVGGLRGQWKNLDISAGPASKELWQQFDHACTIAYAPAAAYFKERADERQRNLHKAENLIAEVRQFVSSSQLDSPNQPAIDWKQVASFFERCRSEWKNLGVIARPERKRLDQAFDTALRPLSEKLAQQRQAELAQRECLIAEAAVLDPQDRSVFNALHALQERWQQCAKAMPLPRKQEQELWQRFRHACDTIVKQRKQTSQSLEAERRENLHAKESLCLRLEAAIDAPMDDVARLLQASRDAWRNIGQVPRAAEQKVAARYKQATGRLQQRIEDASRQKHAAELNTLFRKLLLCLTLERHLADQTRIAQGELESMSAAWQALPQPATEVGFGLRARFDTALAAIRSDDAGYAAVLKNNFPLFAQELLRLELLAGLDSPPEFSKARLQMQVDVLQSALKHGEKSAMPPESRLSALCRLPAPADDAQLARLQRAIARLAAA